MLFKFILAKEQMSDSFIRSFIMSDLSELLIVALLSWATWAIGRVGHSILFHSERSVLFRSFKEHSVLFRSFFEFLATYATQKNIPFRKERKRRNVLLQRT